MFALEKRGYVEAGPWTPESVIEHPEVRFLPMHLVLVLRYFYGTSSSTVLLF